MGELTGQQLERQANLVMDRANDEYAISREQIARADASKEESLRLTKRAIEAYRAQVAGAK